MMPPGMFTPGAPVRFTPTRMLNRLHRRMRTPAAYAELSLMQYPARFAPPSTPLTVQSWMVVSVARLGGPLPSLIPPSVPAICVMAQLLIRVPVAGEALATAIPPPGGIEQPVTEQPLALMATLAAVLPDSAVFTPESVTLPETMLLPSDAPEPEMMTAPVMFRPVTVPVTVTVPLAHD